jgi:DNA polymerase-3 subunit alpha
VTERLPRLREVFLRHPGSTAISLIFLMDASLEVETAPLPRLTVNPSERLVAEVEEVLGKGAVFLLS